MKLKTIVGILLSFSLLVSACSTNNLQGRFSVQNKGGVKVKSIKSTSEVSKVLTVTPSTTARNTITLSEVDFDYAYDESDPFDSDPTWFSVAKFSLKYADGATNCADRDVRITMNDDSNVYHYVIANDDMFENVRLQLRTGNDDFLGYVYPSDSDLSTFSFTNVYTYDSGSGKYVPGTVSLSGDNYFYVEVKAKTGIDAKWKNLKTFVHLSGVCALKDSTRYSWDYKDNSGQNSYFGATADADTGVTGGWVIVED